MGCPALDRPSLHLLSEVFVSRAREVFWWLIDWGVQRGAKRRTERRMTLLQAGLGWCASGTNLVMHSTILDLKSQHRPRDCQNENLSNLLSLTIPPTWRIGIFILTRSPDLEAWKPPSWSISQGLPGTYSSRINNDDDDNNNNNLLSTYIVPAMTLGPLHILSYFMLWQPSKVNIFTCFAETITALRKAN